VRDLCADSERHQRSEVDMQIGKLVKQHIAQVVSYCETIDHGELARLLDPAYSKHTFGINFPFFTELEDMAPGLHGRYWTQVYKRGGRAQLDSISGFLG
jgi:hypothetical protein